MSQSDAVYILVQNEERKLGNVKMKEEISQYVKDHALSLILGIFEKYPALFYYPIRLLDIISIREYIRLKFDIIKLLIFFLYKCSRNKYAYLFISMHYYFFDAVICYTLLQNYNLFLYKFFFLLSPNPVGYSSRRNRFLGYSMLCYISDIRYPVSDNFTIRCIPN